MGVAVRRASSLASHSRSLAKGSFSIKLSSLAGPYRQLMVPGAAVGPARNTPGAGGSVRPVKKGPGAGGRQQVKADDKGFQRVKLVASLDGRNIRIQVRGE